MSNFCTMVGRLGDGLVLAASMDEDSGTSRFIQQQALAKQLLKKLHFGSPPKASLDAPLNVFHYMIEKDVIYIVISDKSTNQERAFTYLKQVAFEFWTQYGDRIKHTNRPYSFIEFDTTLQKLRRSTGVRKRVSVLHSEFEDEQPVLKDTLNSVLEQGPSFANKENSLSDLEATVPVVWHKKVQQNLTAKVFYAKALVSSMVALLIILYYFVL